MSNPFQSIRKIEQQLSSVMHAEKYALQRETARFKKSLQAGIPAAKAEQRLSGIQKRLQQAIRRKQERKSRLPQPAFNADLPIVARKDEIIETIRKHPVVIISGETGSGKTTQLPKMCLEAGRGLEGKIGCTQPRRIAALTVARRIAEELGEEIGRSVGYKIRFQDRTSRDACIKIMTDGILLAETQRDPYLNEYDTIIVDEAHERSLNIDFILGILKNLLKKRKHLKLIITSATIDTEKFSKAFDDAPVIEVSGRMFPVEVRYFPPEAALSAKNVPSRGDDDDLSHVELAVRAVDKLQAESRYGDILIFMPTEQGIRETCEMIEGRGYPDLNVLPLFARLSAAEQSKIFSSLPGRKIIVATNIAETSITIPGIKYVIDSGLARIAQYAPRSRTTALPVLPVSRSSADQRKGRCGRVENGVCIRLYSEEAYEARPFFTPPEILRANLAEVILRMIALRLCDIERFPFIDKPVPKSIRDGFDMLLELGAIAAKSGTKNRKKGGYALTEKGRIMSRIPVDPRLSRMLLEAREQGCLKEMVIIIAVLSIQDPRERPADKAQAADQKHALFKDPYSDFITLLNIWNAYHKTWKKAGSTGRMKKFCRDHFLSFKRMREWRDIHTQISAELEELGLTENIPSGKKPANTKTAKIESRVYSPTYIAIHQSILSGFLSNIAVQKEKNLYKATKGRTVMIFPGSGLFNKAAPWVVAAEMIETSQLFARTVANIESRWLESAGKAHCQSTWMDPHWEKKRGEVVAYEQVTLFGLVIVPRRPVSYGRINPEEAFEIFIRGALVEGDVQTILPFMEHNRKLIEEVRGIEDKIRKRDVLISDEDIFLFYRDRLEGICDIRSLAKYLKDKGNDNFLRMKREDLVRYAPDEENLALFPDQLELGNQRFECLYRFKPGDVADGVTVKIPSSVASAVPPESMDWLVPGLYRDKITTLIKGLPKEYRRRLVPVTSTVEIVIREMPKVKNSLVSALSDFIFRRFGVNIPAAAWPLAELPEYLRMRISVTGPDGKELHSGRDTSLLRQGTSNAVDIDGFQTACRKFEKTGLTRWDFGDLEEQLPLEGQTGVQWSVYPALACEENGVALRLFKDREQALQSHRKGVAALYGIHFSTSLKALKKELALPKSAKEIANYFGGCKHFENQLYQRIIQDLFHKEIRSGTDFSSHAEKISASIYARGQELRDKALRILKAYHDARTTIFRMETSTRQTPVSEAFFQNLRSGLTRLVPETFMELYDFRRLTHLERYIRAIAVRAERGFADLDKDQQKAVTVNYFTEKLSHLMHELSTGASPAKRSAVEDFFWLLEEYRVSVFAQELKTPVRISQKRLEKIFHEIKRMV